MTLVRKMFLVILFLVVLLTPGCQWLTPPYVGVSGPSVDIAKSNSRKRKVIVTVKYPETQPAATKEVQP